MDSTANIVLLLIVGVLFGGVSGWLLARLFDPTFLATARMLDSTRRDLIAAQREWEEANSQNDRLQREFMEERRQRTAAVEKFMQISKNWNQREDLRRVDHRVFLDGPSGSGKSTFMRLITNPWVSAEDLRRIPATQAPVDSGKQPIGFSRDLSILHTLSFFDGVGEAPNELADAVRRHCESQDFAQNVTTALLIWDLTRSWESNFDYFGKSKRMLLVYGTALTRQHFTSFVVLLNKADEHALTLNERKELERRIRAEVFTDFPSDMPVYFAAGSAMTGEGIHHAVGLTLLALNLTELATTEG